MKPFVKPLFYTVTLWVLPAVSVCAQQNTASAGKERDLMSLIRQGSVNFPATITADTLPLELYNGWIVLVMKVNGRQQRFIWDTGTAFSTINEAGPGFEDATVKDIGYTDIVGENNRSKLKIADSISLGRASMGKIAFMLLDTKTKADGLLGGFAGLIGLNIIDKINWNFNFDRKYVIISDKPFVAEKGRPLNYGSNLAGNTLKARIGLPNGKSITTRVLIDFGIPGHVIYLNKRALGKDYKQLKGVAAELSVSPAVGVSGIGKTDTVFTISKANCALGLAGSVIETETKVMIGDRNDIATIGAGFFCGYNFIRNTGQLRLMLFDRSEVREREPETSFGIMLNKNSEGKLYIYGLSLNPNLEGKAIAIGQLVRQIDGKGAEDFADLFGIRNYLKSRLVASKKLELTMDNGQQYVFSPRPNTNILLTGSQ